MSRIYFFIFVRRIFRKESLHVYLFYIKIVPELWASALEEGGVFPKEK